MLRAHRASCLALGALMLTGSAFVALVVVPAPAADVRVSASRTVPGPPQTPARPDVPRPGHGPHDFGWQ
ncbi:MULTISPECIES: hypothetical protein [Streptomycetaceae]|uniref:hypothetical protein n=1 Tax=unclassified Streptomyces TaxID=2593676 RepID=UPI00337213FB